MSASPRERQAAVVAGDQLRLLIALAAIGLLVACLKAGGRHSKELLAPADLATARLSAGLVRISGLDVSRDGAVLSHPGGFSCEIYYECSEWLIILCMSVGLFALPGRGTDKVPHAVAGGAVLVVLNQTRLVHLFWTGVHRPAAFHLLHKFVWEPVMLLSVLALWALWLRYHWRKESLI